MDSFTSASIFFSARDRLPNVTRYVRLTNSDGDKRATKIDVGRLRPVL